MDSQRPHNLGCYGDSRGVTPNIDALAAEGVVFEQNITPGPWSLPAHASMMTGLYPSTHGADGRYERLSEEYPTIGEELAQVGYATVGISNNAYMSPSSALHRGFNDWTYVQPHLGAADDDNGGKLVAQQMRRWLREHADDSRPFFMFVNFNDTHTSYFGPEPYRSRWAPGIDADEMRRIHQHGFVDPGWEGFNEEDRRKLYALIDTETSYVDQLIGDVIGDLRDGGRLDDTAVFVTSDHGDVLEEHPPYWNHQLTVYEAVAHVPLVARYPAAFPAGNRVGALTQTQDVVTTIYELAGADSAVPGIAHSSHSLLRALRGDARTYTLCEFAFPLDMLERSTRRGLEFDLRRYHRALKGFRSGEWKYIWADDGRDELYNLAEDPTEQVNLIGSQRDRARAMYDQLDAVLRTIPVNDYGDWLVTEYMKEVPRDSWEKLRRWGYLRRGQADRPAFRRDTA